MADLPPKSEEATKDDVIKVIEGNTGSLTVKILSDINTTLKRIADALEKK